MIESLRCRFLLFVVLSSTNIAMSLPALAWQLDEDQYVPAKMPMTLVHPRPDDETSLWARHKKAYPDGVAEYRVPIAIQGGAYPFRYELIDGPPGMTVGQTVSDEDYGIVSWTPKQPSPSETVTVRVTDQEKNAVTATWSVEATTSGFVFIDPNTTRSGDGTKSNPLHSFNDLHKDSETDDTYSEHIVYLRGGSHTLSGPTAIGNLKLSGNVKPAVYLGYTGEDVTVECSSSKFIVDHQDDVFASGFRMTKARTDVKSSHFWYFPQNHAHNRTTFFEMQFDDIDPGTEGTENPAAITFYNPGKLREYFTLWGSRMDNYAVPMLVTYAIKYAVIESNSFGKGKIEEVTQGLMLKSDLQNFSVRRNISTIQNFHYGAIEFYLQAGVFSNDQLEISYNSSMNGPAGRASIFIARGAPGVNENPRIYIYRNTINRPIISKDYQQFSAQIERNVAEGKNLIPLPSERFYLSENVEESEVVDSNGELNSDFDHLRGTRGHAIYGSKDVIASKPPLLD